MPVNGSLFCWDCGEVFGASPALDAHQLATGHEMDQPDHPLHRDTARLAAAQLANQPV